MTYATSRDLVALCGERELIQLTDRSDAPTDWIDDSLVRRSLEEADDEVNGYVLAQYALPLSNTPGLLRRLACDIARYRLWKDRPSDEVRQRYDDAIKTLRDISKGVVKLPGVAGVEPQARPGVILTGGSERLFTRDSMRGA